MITRVRHAAAIAAIAAILVGNFAFALTAVQRRASAFRLAPGATVSDLHFRWLGTRELLFNGVNPYTAAAAREGERGYYGRQLTEREASLDPENYLGFNYPLHAAVLMAPLALLPFPVVRVLVTLAMAVLLAWTALAWSRTIGWPATRHGRLLACTVAITWLPALDLLSLQQSTGFVVGFLVIGMVALAGHRPIAAGALMACATIKPQLAALPIAVAVLGALGRPRARGPFLAALGVTLAVLVGASLCLLPTWPAWFLANLRAYAAQVPSSSPLRYLPAPARAAVDALVVLLTVNAFRARPAAGAERERALLDLFALSLAATLVVAVADHVYDRVLLVPALLSLGRRHASAVVARVSPAGIGARVVVAALALVLVGGAAVSLLVRVGSSAAVPRVVEATVFGYSVLPLTVWAGLLFAMRRPSTS